MQNPIITFRSYNTVTSAYVDKAKLDAEWIPSFLENEHMGSLKPYDAMVGGVKLKIFQDDYEKVASLLPDEFKIPRCPLCESTSLNEPTSGTAIGKIFVSVFFAIIPSERKQQYQCRDCGYSFME